MKTEQFTREELNSMDKEQLVEAVLAAQLKNDLLTGELNHTKAMLFGRRSEKVSTESENEQLMFEFNEAERYASEPEAEEVKEVTIGGHTRRIKVKCRKRGYFVFPRVGITTADLFLLDHYTKEFENDSELVVLPEVIPADIIEMLMSVTMSDMQCRRSVITDPFALAGIREYGPGDPMKSINWKASAKTGELMVNQNASTCTKKPMRSDPDGCRAPTCSTTGTTTAAGATSTTSSPRARPRVGPIAKARIFLPSKWVWTSKRKSPACNSL